MKNILFIGVLMCTLPMFAQQKKSTIDTAYIKTSALCGDCKERIESTLNFQKGVKYTELNLETKIATCVYKQIFFFLIIQNCILKKCLKINVQLMKKVNFKT